MLERFVEYLGKNWAVLMQAPLVFLGAFVLALIVAWVGANWVATQRIGILQERLAGLQERLAGKDDLIEEYRQRLHLAPPNQTAYSRLSNGELKQRALNLVGRIRDFLQDSDGELRGASLRQMESMRKARSEEERNAIWQRQTSELFSAYSKLTADYDRNFKIEAIVLRDEIFSRLPESARGRRPDVYEYPTNTLGMREVADDLERLAKLLPQ